MEETVPSLISTGSIRSIKFGIATSDDIKRSSVFDEPISRHNLMKNPWLGLPLELGNCQSCDTNEPGQCEGHFGFIELPVPIYHPQHVSELRCILNLLCLKCLKLRKGKVRVEFHTAKTSINVCSYCKVDLPVVNEIKMQDGGTQLELKFSTRTKLRDGCWSFLNKYGFQYGKSYSRPLLPSEVLDILKAVPEDTKRKLEAKGHFPQLGYVLQHLAVPPNCLCVLDISDGKNIISSDPSMEMLKKILRKIELIKGSRSGKPNFDALEVESNELQALVAQYLNFRGTKKELVNKKKFPFSGEAKTSTTEWLVKMRSLFISKGSGFSSRCVISGDSYKGLNEIGIPFEIAKKITFEERVTSWNLKYLQKLVDDRQCLTYRHGSSLYSTEEGSKGHTALKIGQVVSRRVLEGDVVFVNRPPTTSKHALQAFTVYLHNDHTIKLNPLVCAPFGADFDGDCLHVFYPQSLAAKSEVLELFSVEKQLCSSHSGTLNLQLVSDALLASRLLPKMPIFGKATAQQLAMFASSILPLPAVYMAVSEALGKACTDGPFWTVFQILQGCLPCFDCSGPSHVILNGEIIRFDFSKDAVPLIFGDIATSILVSNGPGELLAFFNKLQPLMMEILFLNGYSTSLKDFNVPDSIVGSIKNSIQEVSRLLHWQRLKYSDLVEFEVESKLNELKSYLLPVVLGSSLSGLIDAKSDTSNYKLIQQFGFLGLQLSITGKLYSRSLVDDIYSHYVAKQLCVDREPSSEAYGLIKSSFFNGLNPFEELVHSVASREVIIRSSRGLAEPGILFKNSMAILRDIVVCYDGTVRHMCGNSIVQFEYAAAAAMNLCEPGEPVGVLAATAISYPAYKAVLDSSQSTNSSWELMKEILRSKIGFSNTVKARSVTLYLKDCDCGRKFCKEKAAWIVHDLISKVTLKDCVISFFISYDKQITPLDGQETAAGLVGHILLDKLPSDILAKCKVAISSMQKKKGPLSQFLRRISLFISESCCFVEMNKAACCLEFFCQSEGEPIETIIDVMANAVFPILLNVVIKGDPCIYSATVTWINRKSNLWIRSSKALKGEVAVEVIVEKDLVKKNGDAWRILIDCCLPVMHLIDMERSLPTGIQQIHHLLGVSCAFDESVVRLSAAIKAVSKNVLKEHLLLVAHSMTCTGNMVGFHTSGYKALCRSLGVEVPFTEATMNMPMKCFERAAERGVTDSLSSVVASTQWGKNVSIGTGTNFQLLWNTEKAFGEHPYEFLHMTMTNAREEKNSYCLGVDIDDLVEQCATPDHDISFELPTFDDYGYDKFPAWEANGTGLNEDSKWSKTPTAWEKAALKQVNTADNNWGTWNPTTKASDSEECHENACWQGGQMAGVSSAPQNSSTLNTGWPSAMQNQNDVNAERSPVWEKKALGDHSTTKVNVVSEKFAWEKALASVPESDNNAWSPPAVKSDQGAENTNWATEMSNQGYQRAGGSPSWQTAFGNHDTARKDSFTSEKSNAWVKTPVLEPESDSWGRTMSGAESDPCTRDADWSTAIPSQDDQRPGISPNSSWQPVGNRYIENSSNKNNFGSGKSAWEKTPEPIPESEGWGRHNENSHTWFKRSSNDNKFERGQSSKWLGNRQPRYTMEEERIRTDVDPIMQSIRRILHQSRDGDRLSVEDQEYVVQKVLDHHPGKSRKVQGEVDFIKVDRHPEYPDTRCFFVASTDGSLVDFSYHKCIQNFVMHNYNEGERFCQKYFRKLRIPAAPPGGLAEAETPGTPGAGTSASEMPSQNVDTATSSPC